MSGITEVPTTTISDKRGKTWWASTPQDTSFD